MKKTLSFLTVILLSLSIGNLFAQQVPELMYFKFSNNTSSTTKNFASSPVGTVQAPYSVNTIGTGGQFDSCMIGTGGTGTSGILPGWNCNLGSSQWTIGFWVKDLAEVTAGNPTYLFGDPGSTSFRCFYGGFALPDNLVLRGPMSDILVPCPMPGPQYIHFVYDGSNVIVYRNGVLVSTNPATINMPTGSGFRVAGYTGGAFGLNSAGKMDEFRLYNRALSASEVAATWNVELGGVSYPLSAFNLQTPPAGARIVTAPLSTTPVTITWDTSATGANYKWVFGNPVVPPRRITLTSSTNSISTTLGALDAILAANGFTNNGSATDSAVGQWNVWAYKGSGATGPDSLVSANGPRAITLKRSVPVLGPLNEDFVSTTFPPPFWGLDAGGGTTQYWTRNAVGGYQTGVGSAKYDYWTASTTTPLQTLTSNEFIPVVAPSNYLRFNYSQAYYLSSGVLAPDSCIIETSADNGVSWTRLIGMGASQTLSSGTNSSPVMSTAASQVAFTPALATDWATKVLAMPVGTNKVRFIGKSGFGNNLYIDNITSGLITGISSNEITMIPDRFELSQNYPNPFNPVTTINFSIAKQTPVTLKVYDMLGKEVARLVNEVKSPGRYTVSFDASNFSSGAYIYKIEAGDFKEIKKMMLIK